MEEAHRQNIFLNPFLTNSDLTQRGDDEDPKAGVLRRWSTKGIHQLKHLWDPVRNTWMDAQDLFALTRSRNLPALRQEIIESVPWSMSQAYPSKIGDWYLLNEPERSLPEEFYHVMDISEYGRFYVHVYRRVNGSERLENVSGRKPVLLPTWNLTRAKTVERSSSDGFSIFNPVEALQEGSMIFAYQHGKILDLDLDPKEWHWPKIAHIKA